VRFIFDYSLQKCFKSILYWSCEPGLIITYFKILLKASSTFNTESSPSSLRSEVFNIQNEVFQDLSSAIPCGNYGWFGIIPAINISYSGSEGKGFFSQKPTPLDPLLNKEGKLHRQLGDR
jgi:hypothetical protein